MHLHLQAPNAILQIDEAGKNKMGKIESKKMKIETGKPLSSISFFSSE
jgi:hypothetical protein